MLKHSYLSQIHLSVLGQLMKSMFYAVVIKCIVSLGHSILKASLQVQVIGTTSRTLRQGVRMLPLTDSCM